MLVAQGKLSDCELLSVILCFLYLGGVYTRKIHRQLGARYREENIYKILNFYYWVKQFAKGCTMMCCLRLLGFVSVMRTIHTVKTLQPSEVNCSMNQNLWNCISLHFHAVAHFFGAMTRKFLAMANEIFKTLCTCPYGDDLGQMM